MKPFIATKLVVHTEGMVGFKDIKRKKQKKKVNWKEKVWQQR